MSFRSLSKEKPRQLARQYWSSRKTNPLYENEPVKTDSNSQIEDSLNPEQEIPPSKGILIVQGNADSRACIRLSGASVVLGGEITQPILPGGNVGTYANLKGYACEYMTAGHVIILGDPGHYAFSGMTGGIVYQKLTPEMGFDQKVLKQRLARGSNVAIEPIQPKDGVNIRSLLGYHIQSLEQTHQQDVAQHIHEFCADEFMMRYFVKITPDLKADPLKKDKIMLSKKRADLPVCPPGFVQFDFSSAASPQF